MHKRFFSVMYAVNIIMQALFSLITPAALLFALSYLFVKKLGAPEWIYVIAIVIGILIGLISMVRFVLSATAGLERLEKEQNKKQNRK